MKQKFLLLIAVFLIISVIRTKAQSAVYFCSQTNQWGYSFGGGNIRNSEADAFKRCQNSGGRSPQKIISTNGKGYGAIVTGNASNGGPKFGTSAGARTQEDATMAAVRSCMQQGAMKNIEVKATWYDK
ncbi:MAG: DUF4189 domain-containing protein [Bacteroidetes bacterium]|nr:DUF4189 domain-containing protein [Bacteroidota bacterium]